MNSCLHSNLYFTCIAENGHDVRELRWTLNGSRVQELNQTNFQPEGVGTGTETLAILFLTAEMNETIIQCTAFFRSGYEVSDEALLIVYNSKYLYTYVIVAAGSVC